MMHVFCHLPNSKHITLHRDADDSVASLVDDIAKAAGVPVCALSMTHQGRPVRKGQTLASHAITNGSTIHANGKLLTGPVPFSELLGAGLARMCPAPCSRRKRTPMSGCLDCDECSCRHPLWARLEAAETWEVPAGRVTITLNAGAFSSSGSLHVNDKSYAKRYFDEAVRVGHDGEWAFSARPTLTFQVALGQSVPIWLPGSETMGLVITGV